MIKNVYLIPLYNTIAINQLQGSLLILAFQDLDDQIFSISVTCPKLYLEHNLKVQVQYFT